jgi:Transposase and inactivated derivatives
VDSNTESTGHAIVNFWNVSDFHLDYHRPLRTQQNQAGEIKKVVFKNEKIGEQVICIIVGHEAKYPEPPAIEEIEPEDTVGIDIGMTKFINDSDGRTFAPLDGKKDREQIETRHRDISRKEHKSDNWNKTQQDLARVYEQLNNHREKLASWYTQEYDVVFLGDLNVGSMMRQIGTSRNIASMS